MEDEEVFAFIRIEDEMGYFQRPTEKQKFYLRPLHVTAYMSSIYVNKVLVDGGATISLLSKKMLTKVKKHVDDLVPTNISVTDYSGVSTSVKGLVTLQVQVGSSNQNIVFMVMSSRVSYNSLLERDWIHGVGVIPSTVHQSIFLWTDERKPEVIKVDSSLYVEQLHVDFKVYNEKLKPLNVDRVLNSYNYEGCFLTSEGLNVKLQQLKLDLPTSWE
ncbi:hypothetical protein Ahy_B03g067347 [Arachis hypogaea]|uniref:Peptidase A2 domain-containing protein n=1 Tax=Arachis hypogaea TaxID=3818 RepID=A0A445A6I1_ARAHY|nr:hypothetical protein Ahy_B03g067347 [Arachis hypogaea]